MTTNTDITIVILNFNSLGYIKKCLRSIWESDLHNIKLEIIVVDNASTDGSVEYLSKEKNIKLINSVKNNGFAAGNNLAKGHANGKYILFLNPDTLLSKNTLKGVYQFMEDYPDVGASTCKLVTADGQTDYAAHRGFPTTLNALFYFSGLSRIFKNTKFFTGYTQGWQINDPMPHEVEVISGAFFFVRSGVADKIGWWDEDYFFYGEDIEFSWAVKERGLKLMYLPEYMTAHYGGVTSGIRKHTKAISKASRETKIRSIKASTDAMRIFYKKHYLKNNPGIVNLVTLSGINLMERYRIAKI